jgi:hypothetical protein
VVPSVELKPFKYPPPKFTLLFVEVNPLPVITTLVPTAPEVGATEDTTTEDDWKGFVVDDSVGIDIGVKGVGFVVGDVGVLIGNVVIGVDIGNVGIGAQDLPVIVLKKLPDVQPPKVAVLSAFALKTSELKTKTKTSKAIYFFIIFYKT